MMMEQQWHDDDDYDKDDDDGVGINDYCNDCFVGCEDDYDDGSVVMMITIDTT